jgi:N-acetylmuramoyl-L-alanine amidase
MIRILLQAGHQNATNGQTGAPEEQANNIRIRDGLAKILIQKGFQVFLGDANYMSNENFDLALAMHCDANYPGNEGGGFVACADPSVDVVWNESRRIESAIASEYFKNSGIREVDTLFYYWWYNLSAKTPCVLIEMGESIDPHDKVILGDTVRVASAIGRGICKAFNRPYDQAPPVTETVTLPTSEYDAIKQQIKNQTEYIQALKQELANDEAECERHLEAQKQELKKKFIDLASTL